MQKYLLVCVMFLLTSCSIADFFTMAHPNTHIQTRKFDGVIFTARNAANVGLGYEFNDPIIDYWTPSEEQVTLLESGLESFLQATLASDPRVDGILQKLERYQRQYFGVTFNEGEPLIYANYFCQDLFDYWLESYVAVMDGGDCFFQLLYNPVTQEFSNLRVNGYA